jgi:hypothetical protein
MIRSASFTLVVKERSRLPLVSIVFNTYSASPLAGLTPAYSGKKNASLVSPSLRIFLPLIISLPPGNDLTSLSTCPILKLVVHKKFSVSIFLEFKLISIPLFCRRPIFWLIPDCAPVDVLNGTAKIKPSVSLM